MSHTKLKWMKDTLVCAAEAELCNLETANTCELEKVIDMIKDIEEALYYHAVTEAMESQELSEWKTKKCDYQNYDSRKMTHAEMDEWEEEETEHHEKDGRSYMSRRMYMEAKETHKDKATQLKELEKYMQELTHDITEMIGDASPEEKQYLEKKITALASKIGQMK